MALGSLVKLDSLLAREVLVRRYCNGGQTAPRRCAATAAGDSFIRLLLGALRRPAVQSIRNVRVVRLSSASECFLPHCKGPGTRWTVADACREEVEPRQAACLGQRFD